MKKLTCVYLTIGLMSLLLLTACGTKADKTNPYLSAPIEVIKDLNVEEGIKTIDVREFITVTFTGLNTFGTAEIEVDYEALAAEIHDGDYTASDVENLVDYFFAVRTKGARNLSNGDMLTVVVEDDLDIYDCRVKESELTYLVYGLEEMKTVDVFADLEITYKGVSTCGIASAENPSTDLFIQSITYEISPNCYYLSEGDIITVRANYSEETARRYGCVAETIEKQYTVEGLGYCIEYPEQINDDCINFMVENGMPLMEKLFDREFEEIVNLLAPGDDHEYWGANYDIVPTGNVYQFSRKNSADLKNGRTVIFFEFLIDLYGKESESDEYELIGSGSVYAGLSFSGMYVDIDHSVHASGPDIGVHNSESSSHWTNFALSESALYELYREEYRTYHICYEPITFDVDAFC